MSVYGPCQGPAMDEFVKWLYDLQIPPFANWLLLRDFKFMRCLDNLILSDGTVNDLFFV